MMMILLIPLLIFTGSKPAKFGLDFRPHSSLSCPRFETKYSYQNTFGATILSKFSAVWSTPGKYTALN